MTSRILTSQTGRFAATGLAGTGTIMAGTEMAEDMRLFKKEDNFPTILKVISVSCAAILGGVFSPIYVPVRVYQLSRNHQKLPEVNNKQN